MSLCFQKQQRAVVNAAADTTYSTNGRLAIQIKRVVHLDCYTTTAAARPQRHLIGDSENRARRCYYVVLKAREINSGGYMYFFLSLQPCASVAVCDWSWRCTPQVRGSSLAGSIKFFKVFFYFF